MPTRSDAYTVYEQGMIVRIQPASIEEDVRVLLMIHGWTGDEHSMSIFGRKVPENFWLIAPRGPIESPQGGFGWVDSSQERQPNYGEYRQSAKKMLQQITTICENLKLPARPLHLMGFSQGAAMAFTLAMEFPQEIGRIAGMAGYLPAGIEEAAKPGILTGKQIFIAHGTRDDIIPIEKAREAVDLLETSGASVTYCEDDVGHKLSLTCFDGVANFFAS